MSIYTIFTFAIMLIPLNNCLGYSKHVNHTNINVDCTADERFINNTFQLNITSNTKLILNTCPIPEDVSLIESFNISGATNIKQLSIIYATLKIHFTSKIFDGLESLKKLKLKNFVESIEPGTFANLSKLEHLRIRLLAKTEYNKEEEHSLTQVILNSMDEKIDNAVANDDIDAMIDRQIPGSYEIKQSSLGKEIFEGLNNLKELYLHENGIDILDSDVFSLLPKLETLNLEYNNIINIPKKLLRENNRLKRFIIGDNRIKTLPAHFLSKLSMLEEVSLRFNELVNISASLFKRLTKIKWIALQFNSLKNLPENLFQDQRNLEELYVQGNVLEQLSDELFKNTPNLRKIYLSHNRITCLSRNVFSSLGKLFELRLDHNKLHSIDQFTFNNAVRLRRLDLSNNVLKSFTSSSKSLKNLRYVNMSSNEISVFSKYWKNLPLTELNLHNNFITKLSISDLQFESSHISINLTFNMIEMILPEKYKELQWNNSKSHITVKLANNALTCDQLNYTTGLMEPTLNKQITFEINSKTCASTIYSPLHVLRLQLNRFCPENCTCSVQDENYVIIVDCIGNDLKMIPQLPQPFKINLYYILHVENNSIAELPSLAAPNQTGYDAVIELHARNNSIQRLTAENLPPYLRSLDISYNKLTTLSEPVLKVLNDTDQLELRISGNYWRCECSSPQFLHFVQQNNKKILDFDQVSCDNGDKLDTITVSDLCKDNIRTTISICFVALIIGLLVGLATAMYYKFELQLKIWLFKHNFIRITEDEIDKDKPYDAFISYSYNDVDFVTKHLIPTLESEPMNFKICWDARDWTPGELIDSQIHKSIENSRRTIILLSKYFLESVWAQMEFRTAYLKSVAEKRTRVFVIIYGDIGDIDDLDCELKTYLKMNTYVRWDDHWFWDKLRYAMPHPLRFYG